MYGCSRKNVDGDEASLSRVSCKDFCCSRNVMAQHGHMSAIIDWKLACSYPLSGLVRELAVELFELDDDSLLKLGQ